jgi:putative SOS response-associated peptidase YedK
MCGRFALGTRIEELAEAVDFPVMSEFEPSWNISPTTWVPVIVDGKAPHFRAMQWGLKPEWATNSKISPINARGETVAEKPMFRNAFKRRRVVVPADGWYEWKKGVQGKIPWYIYRQDGGTTWMAGIHESNSDGLETFSIITIPANRECSEVHQRMPAILNQDQINDWLNGAELIQEIPEGTFDFHSVSNEVNSNSAQGKQLIQQPSTLF